MTLPLKFNSDGLIPVIVQDYETNEVLMLAYANQEAIDQMMATGKTHFWSRSRQALWQKGETSGNVQDVVSIQADCDGDTLLVRVKQTGVACHLGRPSCFAGTIYGELVTTAAILPELRRTIQDRKCHPKEGSYTNTLLSNEDKLLKKIIEEAGELALASKGSDRDAQAWEAADLLYHSMVLMERLDLPWKEVFKKLYERHMGVKK